MTLEDVKRTLRVLVAEICAIDPEKIRDETTIDEDLQVSSIAFVELQVAVEDAFDTILDPVEMVEMNKFGLIAESIHEKIGVSSTR